MEILLENQSILFSKSPYCSWINQKRRNINGNRYHPLSVVFRHPRHSQSFYSFPCPLRTFPALTLRARPCPPKESGLWSKADLDNNSLQLRVTVLDVTLFPQTATQKLNLLQTYLSRHVEYQQRGACISPPIQPSWYWSVIYFVINFIQFSPLLLFPRSVLCGRDVNTCALCSLKLLLSPLWVENVVCNGEAKKW